MMKIILFIALFIPLTVINVSGEEGWKRDAHGHKVHHEAEEQGDGQTAMGAHPVFLELLAEDVGQREADADEQAGGAPVEREEDRAGGEVGERGRGGVAGEDAVQHARDDHELAEGHVNLMKELVEFFAAAFAGDELECGEQRENDCQPGEKNTDEHDEEPPVCFLGRSLAEKP